MLMSLSPSVCFGFRLWDFRDSGFGYSGSRVLGLASCASGFRDLGLRAVLQRQSVFDLETWDWNRLLVCCCCTITGYVPELRSHCQLMQDLGA